MRPNQWAVYGLLLLAVALPLMAAEGTTGKLFNNGQLMPWQWANWWDLPMQAQYMWIDFLIRTTDVFKEANCDPRNGLRAISSTTPPDIQRVASFKAQMGAVNVDGCEAFLAQFQPGRLVTAANYSQFALQRLQVDYWDTTGEWAGRCEWAPAASEVTCMRRR